MLRPPLAALRYAIYFRFVNDVIFHTVNFMAHAYPCAVSAKLFKLYCIESNLILLSDEDRHYTLWIAHRGRSLLCAISLAVCPLTSPVIPSLSVLV